MDNHFPDVFGDSYLQVYTFLLTLDPEHVDYSIHNLADLERGKE